MLFYGVYDMTDAAGTGNRGLVPLLARRVFKTRLDDDRARELASPITHTGPGAPPFFVLHGTNDTVVPVEAARLRRAPARRFRPAGRVRRAAPGATRA